MEKDWINDIDMSREEKNELEGWCDFISYDFYEKIYKLTKRQYLNEKVSFDVLKAYACYNFEMSDILYSAIKYVEYGLRAKIINNCENSEITKQNYLYELNSIVAHNEKQLPCYLYYDNKLKRKCNLYDFLNKGSLNTVIECYMALPSSIIGEKNDKEKLNRIREIRNTISHCGIILDKELNKIIADILEYIPSAIVKINKNKMIKECAQKYENYLSDDIKIYISENQGGK